MDEKAAFSQRLILALKRAGVDTTSPTKVAIAFNLKHRGQSVSTQAVHKWLHGNSIPGQDKVRTFAKWLRVAPEWLRFGEPPPAKAEKGRRIKEELPPYDLTEEPLADAFARLNDDHKQVVREVIATLLRVEAERQRAADD